MPYFGRNFLIKRDINKGLASPAAADDADHVEGKEMAAFLKLQAQGRVSPDSKSKLHKEIKAASAKDQLFASGSCFKDFV